MIYHVKENILTLSNTQIDYITFGKGTKPMIMIQGLNTHGIKGAGMSLAYMYRVFAKDYKVYLFDRRPDVFGVSQGGMIGQYLAIDRPDLVNKLVLAVTLSKNNGTVKKVINDWVEMTEQGDMKKLVTDMAIKMYSDAYIKRYQPFLPLLTILQKPKNVRRFIILAKSCLTCNTYEELDKIACPVFVIGGCQDKVVSGEASEEIAEKLG